MNIFEWIESVQKKPYQTRVRYTWICVLVTMIFIVLIWSLSIKNVFKNDQANSNQDILKQIQEIKSEAPSLNDLKEQSEEIKNQFNEVDNNETDLSSDQIDTNSLGEEINSDTFNQNEINP